MAQFANSSLCRDVGELEENSKKLTDLCWVFMDSKAWHKWLRNLSTLVDTKARTSKMCNNSLSNRLIYLCSELLWLARVGMCHQILYLGKLGAICVALLGEDYWKLRPGISGIAP